MSDDRKDLPAVSSDNFLQRVRETLQTYMGSQGNVLDRGVTLRDLSDTGLIDLSKSYLTTRRGSPVAGPGPAAGGGTDPDLTPPPTPTGFTVGAGISHLFIGCAPPTYSQGHGHLVTRLYGATWTTGGLPVFANATVLTEFQGTVFAHPTNPATTWHLWITWVTRDGVESAVPAGGTNGLSVTTGQDVSSLLAALAGQITQSQLYADLGARIDLIDGSGAGSVNARLSTEASTRATQTGELYAKYTVKVDVAGLISGYGLASTANNAAPTSSFGVRANAFFVSPPAVASATAPTTDLYDGYVWLDTSVVPNVTRYLSGSTWVLNAPVLPFVVQATPTTVNGVAVPAGVYANDLFVKNGTITNAKIANLAVDDAKIANLSVSKLTAGSLAVGQYVQSTNYVPNVSGWQWGADGSAELGSQYIRGKLTAAQIDTRGLEIKDAAGNVILSSGSSLGAQVATTYGGGNLCQNSGFDSGTLDKWSGASGIDLNADWTPHGGHAAYAVQTSGTAYMEIMSANIPVKVGQRYEYHGKTGAHRCNVAVFIYWVNSDNNIYDNTSLIYNLQEAAGGPSLNTWKHHGGFGVAPAGAVAARFMFRKDTTSGGYTDSYMFATQAYFGEAGANQTTFTPWAPSVGGGRFGALDKITSGNASTYIADLAVNTLQISNQAVTINQSATVPTNTGVYGTNPESEYSVISGFAVTSSGAPALLIISVIIYTNYISSDSSVTDLTVRVRDGTWGAQIAGKLLWGSRYSALPGRHPITLAIPVNLSAGTHYLQLTFGMAEDGINHSIFTVESGGTFTYLETKK